MDYRKRDYYLIRTDHLTYEMRHKYYKIAAPSIKYHAPYGHYKCKAKYFSDYDGNHQAAKSIYPQEMVSCLRVDSDALEYELRRAQYRDAGSDFIKVTKEILGQ